MKICETFIYNLQNSLPELCKPKDLIKHGLFKTEQAAYYARTSNLGPPWIKFSGQILYPREGIIKYLREQSHDC